MNVVELIAVACGLACVGLLIRRSVWSWPVGLVQVLLFVWIFWQAKLYSDTILHVIYVVLQVTGWVAWVRGNGRADDGEMPVRVLSPHGLLVASGVALAGTAVLGFAMSFTDAALPWADAFTTAASLTAQVLLVRKVLQNWLFWIAVDVVAVPVYVGRGLFPTAGLYGVFLILAITGYLAWLRTVSTHRRPAASPLASSFPPTADTSTSSTSPAATSTS